MFRYGFAIAAVAMLALIAGRRCEARGNIPAAAGRFTDAVDPLIAELMTRLQVTNPDEKIQALFERSFAKLTQPSGSVLDDIRDIGQVYGKFPPEAKDAAFLEAFRQSAEKLDAYVDGDISAFMDKITLFEQANPQVSTSRQHKGLTKATDALAVSRRQTADSGKRFSGLGAAERNLQGIRKFDYVASPPKKCFNKGAKNVKAFFIRPGEFAHGPFMVFNFDTGGQTPDYFEANIAYSSTGTNPHDGTPFTTIDFDYCNGDNQDESDLEFILSGPGPTYAQDASGGSFRRGKGFGSPMGPGSVVTITDGNIASGVVEGTFTFATTGGDGTGHGSFRIYVGF